MFKTPVRNSFQTYDDEDDLEVNVYSHKNPSDMSPQNHSTYFFSYTRDKTTETTEKIDKAYCDNHIYLAAEMELLKNDLENEKQKTEDLELQLQEKDKTIKILSNHLNEKKNELRLVKKKLADAEADYMLDKNKCNTEIECFKRENSLLHEEIKKFKYAEREFEVSNQEITKYYANKINKLKQIMQDQYNKFKNKEIEHKREKSKLSKELETILNKFELVQEGLPKIKDFSKHEEINAQENILKIINNLIIKDISVDKQTIKNQDLVFGKENKYI
jgi:chromosome segregation ATPase